MRRLFVVAAMFVLSGAAYCAPVFEVVPIGVYGGLKDGNLSAYLVKPIVSENYAALDGGTLVHGLEVAVKQQSVHNLTVDDLLQKHIAAYLISHAHLDHSIGLVMAQPEMREQQTLMAREETMLALQKNIFNWSVWGNFGDAGELPHLNLQHDQIMPLHEWVTIPHTDLEVKTFPLSHGGMASSAFLIRYKTDYLLYFGDTGADRIEKSTNMAEVWAEVAPLIRAKQLRAIMLECSFLNTQPDDKLFGHLKPDLYMAELRELALVVNPSDARNALRGLPMVVTHIKPRLVDYSTADEDTRTQVIRELSEKNDLGVTFIKPEQGVMLRL